MFTIICLIVYILIAYWIAAETHSGILGIIAFFVMLPSIKFVFAADVAFGLFNAFNRKADERAQKLAESNRASFNAEINRLLEERIKERERYRAEDALKYSNEIELNKKDYKVK